MLTENEASQNIFEQVGFHKKGSQIHDDREFIQYEMEISKWENVLAL